MACVSLIGIGVEASSEVAARYGQCWRFSPESSSHPREAVSGSDESSGRHSGF